MDGVGSLRARQGKLEEAVPISRRQLERLRTLRGRDAPDALAVCRSLGLALRNPRRWDESLASHQEELQGYERTLGVADGHAARARNGVGESVSAMRRFAEAEQRPWEAERALSSALTEAGDHHLRSMAVLDLLDRAWHAEAPGAGHDKQAAEWPSRLQARQVR